MNTRHTGLGALVLLLFPLACGDGDGGRGGGGGGDWTGASLSDGNSADGGLDGGGTEGDDDDDDDASGDDDDDDAFPDDDDDDGFPGDDDDDDDDGPPQEECGGDEFTFNSVPPNLMILVDRSGSMTGDVNGTNLNRWEVAQQAIENVVDTFNDQIRFGMSIYSSCAPGGCSAGQIVVPIADNNAAGVHAWLDTVAPMGSFDGATPGFDGRIMILCNSGFPETSTGVSLDALVGEPSLQDPTRTNAVLLLTDGGESSECTDFINGPGGAANLYLQDTSVRVYAVGMGGASLPQLEQIAIAGGTNVAYYADAPGDLEAALADIAATVGGCTFHLDQVPEDLAELYVFFDGDPAGIPQDGMDGWTYDPATNTITFHGSACQSIQSGAIAQIDIVYGCNLPPEG